LRVLRSGGGGLSSGFEGSGGGGAGGVGYGTLSLIKGVVYQIAIGAGGAPAMNGLSSTFSGGQTYEVAYGGGAGGGSAGGDASNYVAAGPGGSGGRLKPKPIQLTLLNTHSLNRFL
jgi:hypothetical protein